MSDPVLDDRPELTADPDSAQPAETLQPDPKPDQGEGFSSLIFEQGAEIAAGFLESVSDNVEKLGEAISDGLAAVEDTVMDAADAEQSEEQDPSAEGADLSVWGEVFSILTSPMSTLAALGGNVIDAFDWMFDSIYDHIVEHSEDQHASQEMREKLLKIAGKEVADAYDLLQEACRSGDQQAIQEAKEKFQELIKALPEDVREALSKALEECADCAENTTLRTALRGMIRFIREQCKPRAGGREIVGQDQLLDQPDAEPVYASVDTGSRSIVFDQYILPAAYQRVLMRQENAPNWSEMLREVCEEMAEAARRLEEREESEEQAEERAEDMVEAQRDLVAEQVEAVVDGAENSAVLDGYTDQAAEFMPDISISKDTLEYLVRSELEFSGRSRDRTDREEN